MIFRFKKIGFQYSFFAAQCNPIPKKYCPHFWVTGKTIQLDLKWRVNF